MNSAEFMGSVFAELIGGDLHLYAIENRQGFGHLGNRPRLQMVAEYCADHWPGDLVEIGVLHGTTTKLFAQVARERGRRVIAVDPFDVENVRYGDNYYQYFLDNIRPWSDIIDIVKLSSMDAEAIQYVKERPLCFAYVDGLHTYEACHSDILTVGHCAGIIAVDDIHIKAENSLRLLKAFWDGAVALDRLPMDNSLSREGYLIGKDE